MLKALAPMAYTQFIKIEVITVAFFRFCQAARRPQKFIHLKEAMPQKLYAKGRKWDTNSEITNQEPKLRAKRFKKIIGFEESVHRF